MSTTITATSTGATTSPVLIDGYETSLESKNIVHDLISGGVAVALVSPRPRAGTLDLVYADADAAHDALELHRTETTFTLSRSDLASIGMTYVTSGAISLRIDDARAAWVLSVGYQEVTP